MKKIIQALLFMGSATLFSQEGHLFPSINGKLLNEQNVSLPQKNNKYSIVAIAYNRDAEDFLKQWLNPLYNAFIKKEKGAAQFDMAELFDVNFVFIPLISGFKKIREDFKANTDNVFWPYILDTEKTDIKELQKQLSVTNAKIPYFYVLDKDGKIVEVQSGKFSEDKLDKLEDAME